MMDRIADVAKKELRAVVSQRRLTGIMSVATFPAAVALWASFHEKLLSIDEVLFWVVLGIILSFHLLFSVCHLKGPHLVQEVYFEARKIFENNVELQEVNAGLVSDIEYLSILQDAALAWDVMEVQYVSNGISSLEELHESIDEILGVVVENREELFGFRPRERWNFAVFLFDRNRSKLIPVWRKKHTNHPSEGSGREWGPGQGHVGKAFADRSAKITSDATDSDVAELLRLPDGMARGYDVTTYRSFASIPIGPMRSDDDPIGVLVATSDEVGRFDLANSLILRHAASSLANVLYLSKFDISSIAQSEVHSTDDNA